MTNSVSMENLSVGYSYIFSSFDYILSFDQGVIFRFVLPVMEDKAENFPSTDNCADLGMIVVTAVASPQYRLTTGR